MINFQNGILISNWIAVKLCDKLTIKKEKKKKTNYTTSTYKTKKEIQITTYSRMFCATNDVLLNISEKTKLLAQKCAHIRNQSGKNASGENQNVSPGGQTKADEAANGTKPSRCWIGGDHSNPACFCGIAGSLRLKLRKSLLDTDNSGGGTTRWYVKVSIIYKFAYILFLFILTKRREDGGKSCSYIKSQKYYSIRSL